MNIPVVRRGYSFINVLMESNFIPAYYLKSIAPE
jgi:hypothetical protein